MTQTQTKEISIETAQAKIEAIRNGLINGDQKIKVSDLTAAKNELEFVELKAQAATIAAEKAKQSERRAHLLELQKQLTAVSDSRKSVDAKFTEFEKSLADYLQTASTYQKKMNSIRSSIQREFLDGSTLGDVPGLPISDIRRVITIGEVSAENYDPHEITKLLIERALAGFDRDL
jgi:septation ring formation regulator EzrA